MKKCRSCGAEIVWVSLGNSTWHPCNPQEIMAKDFVDGMKLITPDGRILTSKDDYELGGGLYGGPLLESHFATCPQANKWRKKK